MSDALAVAIPVVLYGLVVTLVIGGIYRTMVAEEHDLQQKEDR